MVDPDDFQLQEFFPYRVRLYYLAVSEAIRDIYQSNYDIKQDEWRILANLYNFSPLTAKDIADKAQISPVNISRALKSLEKQNYIEKYINIGDRRSYHLKLTDKGQNMIADMIPALKQKEQEFLSDLTPAEQELLCQFMEKVKNRILTEKKKSQLPENDS